MTTIGILLFEDAEELDFVGPWEIFTASSMLAASQGQDPDRVVTVTAGAEGAPVRCAKGLRVLPDHALGDSPPLDVLLVPGGTGTRRGAEDPALLAWIAEVHRSTTWTTSVCTGSLLLFSAGVATGPVATHWGFEDQLEERGAQVIRDARWVRDGKVVTSQGVSAGIDMALWLVGQLRSPAHARAVQRYVQYDPAPPYQADV